MITGNYSCLVYVLFDVCALINSVCVRMFVLSPDLYNCYRLKMNLTQRQYWLLLSWLSLLLLIQVPLISR